MTPDTNGAELVPDYAPEPHSNRFLRWGLITLFTGLTVISWRRL